MKTNKKKVRYATFDDLKTIHDIEKKSIQSAWSFELIKEAFSISDYHFFVYEDESILGYISMKIILDECEIMNIAVDSEERRKGIGRGLLGELILFCKENEIKRILLEVRESNENAINFYQKNKFFEISKREKYYSDGETAVIMARILF
ncbi:MAG: ribosomal protein S18-alanine N-acetyltransferase [Firmicutes bacterium]|nr:ribosomal protein S18-alanine N-acetyltransferase [Bacillota bacterium]